MRLRYREGASESKSKSGRYRKGIERLRGWHVLFLSPFVLFIHLTVILCIEISSYVLYLFYAWITAPSSMVDLSSVLSPSHWVEWRGLLHKQSGWYILLKPANHDHCIFSLNFRGEKSNHKARKNWCARGSRVRFQNGIPS